MRTSISTMHRFYLPPESSRGSVVQLTGDEAHHATRVLRVQAGETVTVLDGAGQELICRVVDADRKAVQLQVVERKNTPAPPCQITLLQAIPKGKIIESIIQKATELGVHRIVPLLSERVATRLDDDAATTKGEAWQRVAIEAVKQCGAAWLPRVEKPLTIPELLTRKKSYDLSLVGSLHDGAQHPRIYLDAFQTKHGHKPKSVCIWIGPEGDFSSDELRTIETNGALPISLGRLVLRVETAAIYCLSFLNYELSLPAASH